MSMLHSVATQCSIVFIFLVIFVRLSDATECISFHDFSESGQNRRINLGFCGASTGYCVRAIYADPDYSKKNGFSLGCDKTDCVGVGNPIFGWDAQGCKKNTDFGANGFICCCNSHDHCNGAQSYSTFIMTFTSIFIFLFLFLRR
uniref:Activin_recp domain-containing protein n=1 Tax=Panagrellus redivivus TaxID=6233 RepID=A0A7E4WDU8_PANRE